MKPHLFFEFTGLSEDNVLEQTKLAQDVCNSNGGSSFAFATEENERRKLWEARHSTYYAALAMRKKEARAILTDACVPGK